MKMKVEPTFNIRVSYIPHILFHNKDLGKQLPRPTHVLCKVKTPDLEAWHIQCRLNGYINNGIYSGHVPCHNIIYFMGPQKPVTIY